MYSIINIILYCIVLLLLRSLYSENKVNYDIAIFNTCAADTTQVCGRRFYGRFRIAKKNKEMFPRYLK